MKRNHQLLTESERDQLLAIPVDRDRLARIYTFEPSDIDFIGARRERRNRLGVALQLALLRHPGTPLAHNLRDRGTIPHHLAAFVAEQLGLRVSVRILAGRGGSGFRLSSLPMCGSVGEAAMPRHRSARPGRPRRNGSKGGFPSGRRRCGAQACQHCGGGANGCILPAQNDERRRAKTTAWACSYAGCESCRPSQSTISGGLRSIQSIPKTI